VTHIICCLSFASIWLWRTKVIGWKKRTKQTSAIRYDIPNDGENILIPFLKTETLVAFQPLEKNKKNKPIQVK